MPYVVTTNSPVMVRLPTGGYYGINQMQSDTRFLTNPAARTLDFEFHEGDDFHFRATQVRGDSNVLSGIERMQGIADTIKNLTKGKQVNLQSLFSTLIPGWNTVASELWTKDGTYYLFDQNGRVVLIKDKTGLSTFSFAYGGASGLLLTSITDDLGRQITFEYSDSSVSSYFIRPVITKINSVGFQGQSRSVSFTYNPIAQADEGLFCFLPTLASTADPLGRTFAYTYDRKCLVSGGGSVKVNFLSLLLQCIPGLGSVSDALGLSALTLSGHIEVNFPYGL